MITTTRTLNEKRRMSALAAERFYTANSSAFFDELQTKYQNCRTSKNTFANTYRTNSFVMRNV
jgi:hypothetical protein